MPIAETIVGAVGKVLDKFVADKDLKAKLSHEIETAMLEQNLAQLEVNKVEAAHRSLFVAGWRPACGWVCTSALAWHFILAPALQFGFAIGGYTEPLPQIELGPLNTVLMGMLGMSGLRSFEKTRAVSREK